MRTPFGDFGKSLKDIPLAGLGIHATKACLDKASLKADDVDHRNEKQQDGLARGEKREADVVAIDG